MFIKKNLSTCILLSLTITLNSCGLYDESFGEKFEPQNNFTFDDRENNSPNLKKQNSFYEITESIESENTNKEKIPTRKAIPYEQPQKKLASTKKIVPKNNDTNSYKYTVQKGDSLWKIAKKYNTTIANIKNQNNLTSNMIRLGDVLNINSKLKTNPKIIKKTVKKITPKKNQKIIKDIPTNIQKQINSISVEPLDPAENFEENIINLENN